MPRAVATLIFHANDSISERDLLQYSRLPSVGLIQ
jgi:hypothetical protein